MPNDNKLYDTLVDLSHFNDVAVADLQEHGIKGTIHKITQATGFVDPLYASRAEEVEKLDLLWGAYHFMSADPVKEQFDHFLSALERHTPKALMTLPCLDWEPDHTSGQETASFEQLLEMIEICYATFKKYPTIYGGYWMIDQLKDKSNDLLGKCPLWQGFYKEPLEIPTSIWKTWSIWQYTDGSTATDLFKNVDRDRFNGSATQLNEFWVSNSITYHPHGLLPA